MHDRITRLLIASFLLLSGCVDNVFLADRTDGGVSDMPMSDAPSMDSPSSICAACGGATSPDCLYAPGCGAVTRVCAANTCGDAVAIAHCGCDGRTFASGCITPDRPYLHTGACTTVVDGGAGPDAPSTAPHCPADASYPRAVVQRPPDTGARFPSGGTTEVRGRWIAPRRLATPLVVDCAPSVAGDPACHPDAVIGVQPDGDAGPPEEWLTSVAFESLPRVAVGTEVVLRLRAEAGPSMGIVYPGNVTLILLRASDEAVLLVVADTVRDASYNGAAPFPFGDLGVQRVAEPLCLVGTSPVCALPEAVFAMAVSGVTGGRAVQPRETAVFGGTSGRYAFHNLVFRHAIGSCHDAGADTGPFDSYGFEIVRQPDL